MTAKYNQNRLQIALFMKDFYREDVNDLFNSIKALGGDLIDPNNPIIVPIPSNAAREIPRLIFNLKSVPVQIVMSFERIDINTTSARDDFGIIEFIEKADEFLNKIAPVFNLIFSRVGLISAYDLTVQDKAAFLKKSILKQARLTDLAETEVIFNYLTPTNLYFLDGNNFETNARLSFFANLTTPPSEPLRAMMDFNTKPNPALKWQWPEVKQFLNFASNKVKVDYISSLIEG